MELKQCVVRELAVLDDAVITSAVDQWRSQLNNVFEHLAVILSILCRNFYLSSLEHLLFEFVCAFRHFESISYHFF